jgi:hypothetical protein
MKTMKFRGAMRRNFASLILLFTTYLFVPLAALAAPITVPLGLNPGDQYRLAFVTSTSRDSQSTAIADYNTHVTSAANLDPTLAALPTTWTAIVSTAAVAARDNTGTNPTVTTGVPIYTLAGDLIAANNAGLWSGNLSHAINVDETGTVLQDTAFPSTGTNIDGSPAASSELGAAAVYYGSVTAIDSGWIHLAVFGSPESPSQFFGISGVLTVPVPEPGTFFLTGIAVAGLVVASLRQRRRCMA